MNVRPITIVISAHSRIHSIIDQIYSLRELAQERNHEIIIIGDRTHRVPVSCHLSCKDCMNHDTNKQYNTVQEWIDNKETQEYLQKQNIQYHLLSDTVNWQIGHYYNGQSRALYMGSILAKNDYIMWSSDDFVYSKNWDKYLFDIINENDNNQYIYQPWLSEVRKYPILPNNEKPIWGMRGQLINIDEGVPYLGDNNCYYIFYKDDYVNFHKIEQIFRQYGILTDYIVKEICGDRIKMHWFPPLFPKSLLLPRIPYPRCDETGWDIYFDNKNREYGTYKICTKNSFMFQFNGVRPIFN